MSEKNPLEPILTSLNSFSHCIQSHVSQLLSPLQTQPSFSSKTTPKSLPFFPLSSSKPSSKDEFSLLLQSEDVPSVPAPFLKGKSVSGLTKEELGRGTWALLHTIAAQYPDQPTRQQKRDVKELMSILSRLYPCKECADHFKEVLKANPVQAGSQGEFSLWLCHVHNVVNRSLGKLSFPCHRVNARWGKLDCKDRACDLQGTSDFK